jgi:hypothetical protein
MCLIQRTTLPAAGIWGGHPQRGNQQVACRCFQGAREAGS